MVLYSSILQAVRDRFSTIISFTQSEKSELFLFSDQILNTYPFRWYQICIKVYLDFQNGHIGKFSNERLKNSK